jgi:hypothetical protein
LVYSTFFTTLHDETSPVGMFGRGTHYSVLRAVTWHDSRLNPLPNAELLDFAVIWDEDHDTRVMMVVETMYFDGLLAPVRFIGERKGGLIVLVAPETAAAWDLPSYTQRVEDAVKRSGLDDWWNVAVGYVDTENSIIGAASEKAAVYLQNIDNLWNLGPKTRPQPESIPDPIEGTVLEDGDLPDFCRRLSPDEVSSSCRRWRGDDEKGAYKHHGAIPLRESPVDIELRWRETENSPTRLIGQYRLDLDTLLAQGYIRSDPKPGHVRLQFVHQRNAIYMQHRAERRLRVGDFA